MMRPSAPSFVCLCLALLALACGDGSPPSGSACKNPIGTSQAAAPEQAQHLGVLRVGQSVTFDVPAGTASVTIVEQAVNAPATITYTAAGQSAQSLDNTAVPLEVRDPSRTLVYDDNAAPPSGTLQQKADAYANRTAFFASNSPVIGTLTIPNTTGGLALVGAAGLAAGTWSAVVSDYAYECTFPQASGATCAGGSTASTYDVTVITKPLTNGAIATAGKVDIVVYFATTIATSAGLAPLSAVTANAGQDTDLNRMKKTLSTLLGRAGITINSLTYVDLPTSVQSTYATGLDVDNTGSCSPLAELLKFGTGGNTMNVFFVSKFNASDLAPGNDVVGIDGTIPGPSTVGGSAGSGAAVATHDIRGGQAACATSSTPNFISCGADITAYIIAHETGHFLGLYHVTESSGLEFDPILDTPMCPCATCNKTTEICSSTATNAHQMNVAECTNTGAGCGGGDNLMFWILDNGSQGTLSADQKRVMLANPLVQ